MHFVYNKKVIKELCVIMSHKSSEALPRTNEKHVPAWKKALATGMAGAALFSLTGCGDKAGAEGAPKTPAASAPKTPEATATPTPETSVEPSFEAKAYAQRLTAINVEKLMEGKTEEEAKAALTEMFAQGVPDPKEKPREFGEIFGTAVAQSFQIGLDPKIVDPYDEHGRVEFNMLDKSRWIYSAAMRGVLGEKEGSYVNKIGTEMSRLLTTASSQRMFIEDPEYDMPYDKPSITSWIRSINVDKDGAITVVLRSTTLGGPDDPRSKEYMKKVKAAIGDLPYGAPYTDQLTMKYDPYADQDDQYSDLLEFIKTTPGNKEPYTEHDESK